MTASPVNKGRHRGADPITIACGSPEAQHSGGGVFFVRYRRKRIFTLPVSLVLSDLPRRKSRVRIDLCDEGDDG